ncbi:uncharacterized protein BCR38DRAFT_95675 [Pseudomassariella vexata]|uniref:Uncharacterized protein n=1 Tax=Pseudomassariella vexata TaxID=1141098 RepID=A0A1Y2EED3_9PEZI|nr:uncharacterized protein BCR38DRAFT_95675 [Pseudomassariella vexata]ORY69932.1 hypothetical protein BCR38DRAFT_95675 [Pseudomassariella vexata]
MVWSLALQVEQASFSLEFELPGRSVEPPRWLVMLGMDLRKLRPFVFSSARGLVNTPHVCLRRQRSKLNTSLELRSVSGTAQSVQMHPCQRAVHRLSRSATRHGLVRDSVVRLAGGFLVTSSEDHKNPIKWNQTTRIPRAWPCDPVCDLDRLIKKKKFRNQPHNDRNDKTAPISSQAIRILQFSCCASCSDIMTF